MGEGEGDNSNETAQLTFVILGIIYFIIALYSFVRVLYTCKFSSDSKLARVFYIMIFIEAVISCWCFLLLGLFNPYEDEATEENKDRLFWSIVLIPDILYLISYGILFWQLVKLILEGHMHLPSELHVPYIRNKGLGYKILLFSLIGYVVLQIMFAILYLVSVIQFVDFVLQLSIIITIVWVSVLLFLLLILIKFSGRPYQNNEYKTKLRTLLIVVIVWSVLKIIRAGFGFTRNKDSNFIRKALEGLSFKSDNKWQSLQFIIIFLVCEIIPFLMVLDASMIKIFRLEARKHESFISVEETEEDEEELGYTSSHSQVKNEAPALVASPKIQRKLEEIKDQGNTYHKASVVTDNRYGYDYHFLNFIFTFLLSRKDIIFCEYQPIIY